MPTQLRTAFIRYQYDAMDRLVSHGQSGTVERQRFYCNSQLTTEIGRGDTLSIVQHEGQLLAQQRHQRGEINNSMLATDLQNSVLGAHQANSKRTMAYSPYGFHCCDSGLTSLLGFNGQRPDPLTGHYLLGNGYRAFNPVLMRFNSPDDLSPFDEGGLNTYVYCAGDPVNRNDSTGHFFSAIKAVFTKIKARYLSFVSGHHVKPVKQYTRISEGLAVFVDKYKGGSRLNVYGHGTSSGGVMKETGIFLGPKSLTEHVKNAGFNFESFDSVRLLTCHSGSEFNHLLNPSNAAFGQLFSDFSRLPVKAYKGKLLAAERATSSIRRLKVGETSARTEYFSITKKSKSRGSKFFDASYDPISFQPSALIRNVRSD